MDNEIFVTQSDSININGIIDTHGFMTDQTSSFVIEENRSCYATGDTQLTTHKPRLARKPSNTSPKREHTDGLQQKRLEFDKQLCVTKAAMDKLVQATNSDDVIEKSNAAFELVDALDALWRLRQLRGDDWIDMLNHLQGVLRHENYEKFTGVMVSGLKSVVDLLSITNMTSVDLSDALEILIKSGFDPWRAMSDTKDIP